MMTAHGTIQTAVEAMKRGAMDYLCKPFDPDELSLLMERLLAHKLLRDENMAIKEQVIERHEGFSDVFLIQSDPMRRVFATIEEVAPSSAPILITGETGVGKDMVAKAIHLRSEHCCGHFLAVNCGSLSETLLESELFGHERGAFTGAIKARRGRLEMADGGTLFLDEVGEISPKMQVSLLRVLEEKNFILTQQFGAPPVDLGKRRMTPKYSIQVTNELFHNGNVEAWKKIVESFKASHPDLDVMIFYENEVINDINTLFKWGKVKSGNLIFFQVVGENIRSVSKLQKYLFEGASPRFEQFLKLGVGKVLNLF